MLSSRNYTKASFQRCLFESILAIYITCTNKCYKHNTNFSYTVIIIKNNQKYQNSCCIVGSSASVSWVFMILQHSDCLDSDCCLHLQKLQHFTLFILQVHTISLTHLPYWQGNGKSSGFVPPSAIFGTKNPSLLNAED